MTKSLATVGYSADVELAARCVAGDRQAHERLFDELSGRVHVILFRILGSNRELEDLTQEAMLAVFRSLGSYRGEAALATWVDRITTRVALAYLTRPRVTTRLEIVPSSGEGSDVSPERDLQLREVARRLYAVLDRLSAKYRIAYALHVIDDRPLQEMATILGISLIAAKNRVWRAKRMVRHRAQVDPVLRDFLNLHGGGRK